MMKEMSHVASCHATDCSYNRDSSCSTMAITVGGFGDSPQCSTFLHSTQKGGLQGIRGVVGACEASTCSHNTDRGCTAGAIAVDMNNSHPDCMTYSAR
ncbi:DUF1540 domain-containing protein [Geobacter sp. FeAm09]|uniref:DUF1540 domain-containing protein n=1 Tax=Geobacter sp. FeAm09 TaxID=2597769 RepID=UPI0011F06EC5|nr:DUF1540 domain-containing protein [Geobacter sp. FeAm09]QEM70002.1 DUF1540 domain-containing protein [Geobacter sp. FeAm09]